MNTSPDRPFVLQSLVRGLAAAAFAVLPLRAADPVPLTQGHMDLGIGYEDGVLVPHLHAHAPEPEGTEYAPGEAVVIAGPAAQAAVPAHPAFGFLGMPGAPVWILPAVEHPDLPFLGLAAEEIESGLFAGDTLRLTLNAVSGPGAFALYRVDGFGQPTLFMRSADGITSDDFIDIPAGSHGHANWAFTAPGDYELTFTASGTPVGGTGIAAVGTFKFQAVPEPGVMALLGLGGAALGWRRRRASGAREVPGEPRAGAVPVARSLHRRWSTGVGCRIGTVLFGTVVLRLAAGVLAGEPPRARLLTEHADIGIVYRPDALTNLLAVVVSDDDHGQVYASNEVALVALEAAKLALPPGTIFGEEGAPFWVLPQTQNPQLLYLGLSGEALASGLFGGELELRLVAVDGPGHFFLWQAGAFGEFDQQMSTADGISADDRVRLSAGSHGHYNWGFTTNGTYEIVFQAIGQRRGVGTNDFSPPTPLRFEIEPLPPEPGKPFASWQKAHWPGVTDPTVIGPGADPDGDHLPNAVEYALGSDPHRPGGPGWPMPVVVTEGSERRAELRFSTPRTATDVEFFCWRAAGGPVAEWMAVAGPDPSPEPVPEGFEPLRFAGGAMAPNAPMFLKLEVVLR